MGMVVVGFWWVGWLIVGCYLVDSKVYGDLPDSSGR
jgi:hypothetical protein